MNAAWFQATVGMIRPSVSGVHSTFSYLAVGTSSPSSATHRCRSTVSFTSASVRQAIGATKSLGRGGNGQRKNEGKKVKSK